MDGLDKLLGNSPPIVALRARARQLLDVAREARRPPPVLLQGEVGSGKNLLARALHEASGGRAAGPFVHVQCNAIPETLAESLLFGHERGAFTGADRARAGFFRTAHRGTILLDEIGTLSDGAQARLLQVVNEGLVPVIGLPNPVPVDVWVICATNVNLEEAVRERRFRADLLSRLTVWLTLPPLRSRRADIVPLAQQFLAATCADFRRPLKSLSPSARSRLEQHSWPDNARGLRNVIEKAVIFTPGPVIAADNLELDVSAKVDDDRERHLDALEQTGWNISQAARRLGISRPTLRARIARWKLQEHRPAPEAGEPTLPEPRAPDVTVPVGDTRSEIQEVPAVLPVDPREVRWEHRWLGFLRFDLTGADADDTMVGASPYVDMALEKVQQFGGHVVELWPTGLDAAFGLDATEGAAQRAGFAALAVQVAAARRHQDSAGAPDWGIALHAMSCLVGSHGLVPRIDRDSRRRAAEVMDAIALEAKQGVVLASGDMAPFLRRRFIMSAALGSGPARHARPVLGPSIHPGDFGDRPGRFVGRHQEIETLQARAALARQGHGQIVGIVGDPGVGKSRLVWEFAHGGPDRGLLVLETASVALGRPTPFSAVIDLLRLYFDVAPGEAEEVVRDKVTRRLAALDETLMSSVPVFLALLDVKVEDAGWQAMDPTQRRRQTLAGIKRLMLRESTRQPLLLVFEDAHWTDAETRELLDELAEGIPVAHVLMLVTYRPEHQHDWGAWSFYTHLRVDPLRGESVDRLLDELLGGDASLASLRPLLIQWTDGNPFFVEEVVRTLVESGALQGERGAYRLTRAVDGIVIPSTVEDVLASRISRLGSGPAEMLRAAAVVGRQVPYSVLAAVSRSRPGAIEPDLRALQGGEFLYQAGDGEEREYTFRHALTQEVAYASLADEPRRVLHSRAMEAIALVGASRGDEKINELAHHAFEGRVWDRAVGYLRRAGQRAFARSANREATECFTRALTALSHLPPSRVHQEEAIDLRFDLRRALWPLGEMDGVARVLEEAGALAETLDDPRRQSMVAAARSHYLWVMSRHVDAVAAADQAVSLARVAGDGALERDATLYMGIVHGAMGNYRRAVEVLRSTLTAYEAGSSRLSTRDLMVSLPIVRTYLARYLAELGDLPGAAEHAMAGMKVAEGAGSPFALATGYFGVASVELRRGGYAAAIPTLERALEICRSQHVHNWSPAIGASLGYALANAGRPSEGLTLAERATRRADRMQIGASYSLWLTYLADAHLRLGQLGEAQRAAEAALERARKHGEQGHEAWALFLLASVAARAGASGAEGGEKIFEHAIELAGALGMRPLLAYCHAGLADACDRLGRAERAGEARARAQRIREEIGMISPEATAPTI